MISFVLPAQHTVDELPAELRLLVSSNNGEVVIRTTEPTRTLLRLCGWAMERELELPALEVVRPSLEDIYMRLVEDGGNGSG